MFALCIRVSTYVRVCMHVMGVCMHAYVYTSVCMCVCVCVCVCMRAYACVYACACGLFVCPCAYTA